MPRRKGWKCSDEVKANMAKAAISRAPRLCSLYGFSPEFVIEQKLAGNVWCSDCKTWYRGNGKRCKSCRDIRNRSDYYRVNAEKIAKRKKQRRLERPEHHARLDKIQNWRQYGVDEAWYIAKLSEQGGGCALCKTIVPSTRLRRYFSVDHNHACCGQTKACDRCRRGLLCDRCNQSLERVESIPGWLDNVVAYIAKYSLR